jgi:hypothetical protein
MKKKRVKNLKGSTFGYLTARQHVGFDNWECECFCGKTRIFSQQALLSKEVADCGCGGPTLEHLLCPRCGSSDLEAEPLRGEPVIRCQDCWARFVTEEALKVIPPVVVPEPPPQEKPKAKKTPVGAYENLAGRTFGNLLAKYRVGPDVWYCSCKCGNSTKATAEELVGQQVTSCGCLLRKPESALKGKLVAVKKGTPVGVR